jgi:hypothetical protein
MHFQRTPGNANTFKEYAENAFFPTIKSESKRAGRIDIVFDTYKKDSLKSTTRELRGKGIRRKVESESKPPQDWRSFLRINQNKTE